MRFEWLLLDYYSIYKTLADLNHYNSITDALHIFSNYHGDNMLLQYVCYLFGGTILGSPTTI